MDADVDEAVDANTGVDVDEELDTDTEAEADVDDDDAEEDVFENWDMDEANERSENCVSSISSS